MTAKSKIELTKELFAPVIKVRKREKIRPRYIDECFSIDLLDLTDYGADNNNGFRYVLTCIDNFSKYAFGIPIKDKSSKTILEAFKQILKSGRKPKQIWSDRGKEFYNKDFLSYLEKNNITIYSTYSELKAVFVERFNRTLRDLLKVPVFVNRKYRWIDELPKAIKLYNNRKHRTIKMTPIEASMKENESKVRLMFVDKRKFNKPKFKVGDLVRIQDIRNKFSKGDSTNWGNELFKIYKISDLKPPQYLIEDEKGEKILGNHYEEEMLKSNFSFKRNQQTLSKLINDR